MQVGETEKKNYEAGAHTMRFHSDGIALGDVKKSWLNNVGLLTASLTSGEEDIAQICAVTQVTKGADGEPLNVFGACGVLFFCKSSCGVCGGLFF